MSKQYMSKPTTLIKKVLIYHDDEWEPPEGYEIKTFQISPKDPDYFYVLLKKIKDKNKKEDIIA